MKKFSVQSVGTATILILSINVINRLIGLLKEILLAKSFGITEVMDAFVFAQIIPFQLMSLLIGGLSIAFIPIFIEKKEKIDEKESILFSNALLFRLLILGTLITFILYFLSPYITKIFSPNLPSDVVSLRVNILRILTSTVTLIFLIGLLSAIYKSYKHFIIPSLSTLILNISIVTFILLFSKRLSIFAPTLGIVFGLILQFLFLSFPLIKRGFFVFNPVHKDINRLFIFSLPVIFGNNIVILNMLIDKFFASYLSSGYLSALNYASRIVLVPYTFFALSLSGAIYPYISTHVAKKENRKGENLLKNSLRFLFLILFPSSVGLIVLANPIVSLIFQRGMFDVKAVNITSSSLIFYSIGLPFFGGIVVLLRYFFSEKDSNSPLKAGILSVVVNIILNLILMRFMGHNGISLSTSISSAFMFGFLYYYLKKNFNISFSSKDYTYLVKIFLSSLIMGIFTWSSFKFLPFSRTISFIFSLMFSPIVYYIALTFLRVEERNVLLKKLMRYKL